MISFSKNRLISLKNSQSGLCTASQQQFHLFALVRRDRLDLNTSFPDRLDSRKISLDISRNLVWNSQPKFISRHGESRSCSSLEKCRLMPPITHLKICLRHWKTQRNLNNLAGNSVISYSVRRFSAQPKQKEEDTSTTGSVLDKFHEPRAKVPVTATERVAEQAKDLSSVGIILLGIGATFALFYMIGRELFSPFSPNRVYAKSLKLAKQNEEVVALFGWPIKGFGEETRRGRRRHVANHVYLDEQGYKRIRVLFYLKGPLAKGIVQAEMREDENKKWDFRYLLVQTDDIPAKVVVLKDNR